MTTDSPEENYAHTDPEFPNDVTKWEPLFSEECVALEGGSCSACESLDPQHGHLNKVAWWAGKFAEEMFPPGSEEAKAAREWGYLAGLWHDLGKFAPEWQEYLRGKADPHRADTSGKLPHSTSGAQYADEKLPFTGVLIGYLIAGHHSGLSNGIDSSDSSLEKRLKKEVPEYLSRVPSSVLDAATQLHLPKFAASTPTAMASCLRFLFSVLVDADFLATEAFMSRARFIRRKYTFPEISEIEEALNQHLLRLQKDAEDTPVNRIRSEILKHCLSAAEKQPGLFSLTVPTGGGKTLSSLAFALKHARLHGLRRIIYVIPFTSIIEQNAAVFRKALASLGVDLVVEHHSNLDPDEPSETTRSRLLAENWNAQIIVTTNVQFFESLQANRSSRCRKLHRIARSVIILDEAQTLPVEFLQPCLESLSELTTHYGSSVVLCTATQPAIEKRDDFPAGLHSPTEIIPHPKALYKQLRRVEAVRLTGKTDDASLIHQLEQHQQVLCIVNTRRHAREIFEGLPNDGTRFHLSALMCPVHRTEVLNNIRQRLRDAKPVRLVSTQLIEAGVDIDFPTVFRAMAGLDSIAQAAGRCDREGRITQAQGGPGGRLFVFEPSDVPAPSFVKSAVNAAILALASDPEDLLHLDCIKDYFQRHYWDRRDSLDQKHIAETRPKQLAGKSDLFCFSFRDCAERFRLIDDYTEPVIIPYGEKGKKLCKELRSTFDPAGIRALGARLQRYVVAIPAAQHHRLREAGVLLPLHDEIFFVLNSTPHYFEDFGLHPEPEIALSAHQSIL